MLNFKEFIKQPLNEVFDQPYPITVVKMAENAYQAKAKLADGRPLDIYFTGIIEGEWSIDFNVDGRFTLTGKGDAFKIMTTVVVAIEQFVEICDTPVNELTFSASVEDNFKNTSRIDLYRAMLNLFSKRNKTFTFKEYKNATYSRFRLFRRKSNLSESQSLNNPYPVNVVKNSMYMYTSVCRVDDGRLLDIRFLNLPGEHEPGEWYLHFKVGGSMDVTGKGDAFRIMATVIKATEQFVKICDGPLEKIIFSAMHSKGFADFDGPESLSRVDLYRAILKRYAKKSGQFVFTEKEEAYFVSKMTIFTLTKTLKESTVRLNEVFGEPYWLEHDEGDDNYVFTTSNGRKGEVFLYYDSDEKCYDVFFEIDGSMRATGNRDAYRIMATAIKAMMAHNKLYNQKKEPYRFTSHGDSRTDLYRAILKRYKCKFTEKVSYKSAGRETEFIITAEQ